MMFGMQIAHLFRVAPVSGRVLTGTALLLAAALLFAAAPLRAEEALVDPRSLSGEQRAQLLAGERLLWSYKRGNIDGAQAMAVLPVSRPAAYELLVDYPTFADWMRSVAEITTVTWLEPQTAVVGYRVPALVRDVHYALRRTHEPPRRVHWELDGGDLRAVYGAYDFYEIGPEQTLVRFWTLVDPGVWVPAFVKRHFSKRGLDELVEDIQAEASRRYSAQAPPAGSP